MPRTKKKARMPTQVNAFVVSLRIPPDTTLGQVRTAILAVKQHLGALCAELGGPDVSALTDVSISSDKGLFLVGTPAPENVTVAWPEYVEPSLEGVLSTGPQTGSGTLKLVAEARASGRAKRIGTKAKRPGTTEG